MISAYLRAVWTIARKDLLLEARNKRSVNSAFVFAALVVVVLAFVFAESTESHDVVARASLWIALVFAGTVGMTRAVAVEGENGALSGLMLAPVDRSAIYLGKVLSTTLVVTAVGVATLAFVAVFLDYGFDLATVATLLFVLPLGALGFCAVGVLLSTLLLDSELRESLLPVLLIPLVIPVILAGIQLSRTAAPVGETSSWLTILVTYDALVVLTGWVTFDYVVEE